MKAFLRVSTTRFSSPINSRVSSRRLYPHANRTISSKAAIEEHCVTVLMVDARDQGSTVRPSTTQTKIVTIDPSRLGDFRSKTTPDFDINDWHLELAQDGEDAAKLRHMADELRESDVPVAFPTETVYGLGADATRSAAVQGIYRAKQRPSDNPLIVHFASLVQLRQLLASDSETSKQDPIPSIYKPLIDRFWPGPLTIILPNPSTSPLAPQVTAGLTTFGARIPRNPLALALIRLADRPIAAPSANASTKPSPTAAEHVFEDLDGRINFIIDGGPCDVGVESTVVDGLSYPPAILRPGGISIEQLRACSGWEDVRVAYKSAAEQNGAPRAPGMKYRHYSPKAPVVLGEAGQSQPDGSLVGSYQRVGFIRTRTWNALGSEVQETTTHVNGTTNEFGKTAQANGSDSQALTTATFDIPQILGGSSQLAPKAHSRRLSLPEARSTLIFDISLGDSTENIARGIFSALRELDRNHVDVIFVEGIDDDEGDLAAAIMNRLRKAAESTLVT